MGRKTVAFTAALVWWVSTPLSGQAVVDFESLAVGTQFGSGFGQLPGDLIFTESGVAVSIDEFTQGTFTGFNFVTIGGFTDPAFPTTPATINNVRLVFDPPSVDGGDVTGASFEYVDFGGSENLVINGAVAELSEFSSAPMTLGGVNVVVNTVPSPILGVNEAGTVVLDGVINTLEIGGQELGIDNVRFIPEPASAAVLGLSVLTVAAGRRKRSGV